MKKESLGALLDNLKYFEQSLDITNLNKADLIRFYLSSYQFFRKKYDNARSPQKKIEHQKQYKNFWNLYCWMVSSSREKTATLKNNDFYDFM
jgi:hypothetical protein